MFITKMHLSRRTMLRGLGAALALPVLDSMVPALTALADTAAAPVRRLGVFYVPNGMSMPYWFPKTEGPLAETAGDAPVAGRIQGSRAALWRSRRRAGESGQGRRRPRALGRHLPDRRAVQAHLRRRRLRFRCRWIRSPPRSSRRKRSWPRSNSASSRTRCSAPATAARAAPTPTRSPGARRRRRCRSRTIRARCSSGCSGPAAARIESRGSRASSRTGAFSISSAQQISGLQQRIGPRRQDQSHGISRLGARRRTSHSDGRGNRIPASCRSSISRLAFRPTMPQHAKLMMDMLALAYQTDLTRVSTFMLAREVSGRVVSGDWRRGFASSALAPSGRAGEAGAVAQDQRISLPPVCLSRREAVEDAGGRRHDARSHAVPLRHRDQRQQHAFPRRSADRARGRQSRRHQRRSLHPLSRRARRSRTCT